MFNKGDKVRMTGDALENYGHKYCNKIFVITHVAWKYMPSTEYYIRGMPEGYHPGYDGDGSVKLYDLKYLNTGEEFCYSLYDWEVEEA